MNYKYSIDMPVNGRPRKATVRVFDEDGKLVTTDEGNIVSALERGRMAKRLRKYTHEELEEIVSRLTDFLTDALRRDAQREQERRDAAAHPDSLPQVEVLETAPEIIRRPLCLIGGHAYAAAWLHVQTTTRQGEDRDGKPVTYDPPQTSIDCVLAVVRDDGQVFADAALEGVRPLSELGVAVALPYKVTPSRGWSGAGVTRFQQGVRPDPAAVFRQCVAVVSRFMDFKRSLAPQEAMCELVACYVLATYLLDAFSVIGYLWPNGEPGSGKTNFLLTLCEMAYLGEVILAGGSYATLRDLADYGACLSFDDAESIMDVKRTDPDKRTLLLAGNRRGATVTVKEPAGINKWEIRHVNTFCPRQFSAIRLPDPVLASRTTIIPLMRSSDATKAKANPLNHATWPCDRRRLIDDLWAVGLANLPSVRAFDDRAAERSQLLGRDLEPWRAIFAVALWLEQAHGVDGLHGRMEQLSQKYQEGRSDLEAASATRVAIRALQGLLADAGGKRLSLEPAKLSSAMNVIAAQEAIVDAGETFTTPKKVGWLLKRLRFEKGKRDEARHWIVTAEELEALALSYGMVVDPPKPAAKQPEDMMAF